MSNLRSCTVANMKVSIVFQRDLPAGCPPDASACQMFFAWNKLAWQERRRNMHVASTSARATACNKPANCNGASEKRASSLNEMGGFGAVAVGPSGQKRQSVSVQVKRRNEQTGQYGRDTIYSQYIHTCFIFYYCTIMHIPPVLLALTT